MAKTTMTRGTGALVFACVAVIGCDRPLDESAGNGAPAVPAPSVSVPLAYEGMIYGRVTTDDGDGDLNPATTVRVTR